jgi:hypothetical protein
MNMPSNTTIDVINVQVMECVTVCALGITTRTLAQAAYVLLSIFWCLWLWLVVIAGNVSRSVF